MAYVGRGPRHGFLEGQTHTFNGSETTVTLERNVSSTDALDVFIDNVHQEPDVAYTLASGGDQLSFTGTPLSGQKLYVRFHGITFDTARAYRLINTPATSTLTLSDAHVLTLDLNGTTALTATTSGITIPNLTVTGTTTTVNSTQLNIGDNLITLNSDLDSSTAPSQNAGIEVNRGSSSDVSFLWDESADYWAAGEAIVSATRLSVLKSGTTPSLAATTLGVFKNSATSQNAAISIIANSGQSSLVNFGDENDEDVGQLSYSHVSDAFAFNKNISVTGNVDASELRVGNLVNNGTISADATSGKQAITAKVQNNGNSLFQGFDSSNNVIFQVTGSGTVGINGGSDGATLQLNKSSSTYIDLKSDNSLRMRIFGDSNQAILASEGVPLIFKYGSAETMRLDASSNATFAGTISSGDITISGDFPRLYFIDTAGSDLDAYIVNNANGLFFGKTNSPSASNDILALNLSDKSATFAGAISSGAITSSGTITGAQDFKATGNNMKLHAGGNHIINMDLNGKFYPQTHNAVDLGFSSTLAFKNLYLSGTISSGAITTNIASHGTLIDLQVGGASKGNIKTVDNDVVIHTTESGHSGLRLGNTYVAPTDNAGAVVNGTIDLGLDSYRFNTVKALSGDFTTTGTASLADGTNTLRLTREGGHAAGSLGTGITFAQRWYDQSTQNVRTGGIFGIKSNGSGGFGGGLAFYSQPNNANNMIRALLIDSNQTATFAGAIGASGTITATTGANIAAQTNMQFGLRDANSVNMRANFMVQDNLNSGRGALAIQATEAGVSNDRDLYLQPAGGRVGILTSVPQFGLDVGGTTRIQGAFTATTTVAVARTGPDTSASMGGQTPAFSVTGYSSIGGLRVNGADPGNTIYRSGGAISVVSATDYVKLESSSASILLSAGNADVQIQSLLGVGTTSPRSDIRYTSGTAVNTKRWGFGGGVGGTNDVFYIINEGNVGQYMAHGAQAWTAHSDERIKENIVDVGTVLPSLMSMRCVKYNLISNPDHTKIGFIAQDWETPFPEIVDENDHLVLEDDGTVGTDDNSESTTPVKAMAYTETIPLLLKAIQELSAKVDEQAAKIAVLESN